MKYLVISHSLSQQQTAHDRIQATTRRRALEAVGQLRPDHIPVTTYTVSELVLLARALETATPAELEAELEALERQGA